MTLSKILVELAKIDDNCMRAEYSLDDAQRLRDIAKELIEHAVSIEESCS